MSDLANFLNSPVQESLSPISAEQLERTVRSRIQMARAAGTRTIANPFGGIAIPGKTYLPDSVRDDMAAKLELAGCRISVNEVGDQIMLLPEVGAATTGPQ